MDLTIQLVFYMIAIITQLILATIIAYKAVKTRIKNLWILSLHSVAQSIVFWNIAFGLRAIPIYYYTVILLSYILAIVFIQQVFYKGRKSKGVVLSFFLVFTVVILLFIADTAMAYIDPTGERYPTITPHTRVWINLIWALIPNVWCGQALIKEYLNYRKRSIEPWIKKRYLIAGLSHISWSTLGVGFIINIYLQNPELGWIYLLLSIYIFTIGSFIAWSMPTALKRYLNRNYQVFEFAVMTEEELMKLSVEEI